MKDMIKIVLLAIIAGTLIIQTIGQQGGGSSNTFAQGTSAAARPSTMATPATNQPAKNTFDPLTPPTAAPVDNGPKSSISFPVMDHDFGKVKQNSENKYTFKFTNTGKLPLTISNAQGSCGCTVPDYPKAPIAPGAVGDINVVYKPGMQQGNQAKTVTVTANTDPPQTILRINADVQVDPNAPKVEGGH
jgi:Protein of unknown function (DUF1573)